MAGIQQDEGILLPGSQSDSRESREKITPTTELFLIKRLTHSDKITQFSPSQSQVEN